MTLKDAKQNSKPHLKKTAGKEFYAPLAIHAGVVAIVVILKFLGIASDQILLITVGLISLEALSLVFINRLRVNKALMRLKEIEMQIADDKEEAVDSERIHRELLYYGHQLKTMQAEIDALRKNNMFKSSGNGHQKRTNIRLISHS